MNTPLVSIITPTYNHEAYIEQCIQSVQAQTFQNWEHIIIDDGSTDNTPNIIKRYAAQDKRIKPLLQRRNRGPQLLDETYNQGLRIAQGKWIAVLEGDDYWFPSKLDIQLAQITDDTLVSYGLYVDEIDGRLLEGRRPPFTGAIPVKQFIPYLLLHQSYMIAVTQLINKQALLQIGGFHQDGSPAAVDMATMMRLINLPGSVIYIPKPLGVWRHHARQSTNVRAVELAKFNTKLVLSYYNSLPEHEKTELGITEQQIIKVRRAQIADAYFGVIRYRLAQGNNDDLHTLVRSLWHYGGGKRKLQACYALLAGVLGFNFELILSVAKRIRTIKIGKIKHKYLRRFF